VRIVLEKNKLITYSAEKQHVKIMKIIKTVFFTILFTLLNVSVVLADEVIPPYPIEEPPGGHVVPIDSNLIFLVIAGLLLGITIIYRNKYKKASM
jgi:hypothetical protein